MPHRKQDTGRKVTKRELIVPVGRFVLKCSARRVKWQRDVFGQPSPS